MHIEPYQEIIGTLQEIIIQPTGLKLVIIIRNEIIVPIEPNRINHLLGKKIQIFNNNGIYLIKGADR